MMRVVVVGMCRYKYLTGPDAGQGYVCVVQWESRVLFVEQRQWLGGLAPRKMWLVMEYGMQLSWSYRRTGISASCKRDLLAPSVRQSSGSCGCVRWRDCPFYKGSVTVFPPEGMSELVYLVALAQRPRANQQG
jgi:hypothetical protein